MKKYLLILIFVAFLLTSIVGSAIINPMLKLDGIYNYFATAAEFVIIALVLYKPIKKKFE